MKRSFLFAVFLSLLVLPNTGAAQSSSQVATAQIDGSFSGFGASLGNRSQSIFAYRAQRNPVDGTLILCGGVQVRGSAGGLGAKSRNAMALTMNGKRVVRGLRWFPIISTRDDLRGSTVPCHAYPKVSVPEGAKFDMVINQRRISG